MNGEFESGPQSRREVDMPGLPCVTSPSDLADLRLGKPMLTERELRQIASQCSAQEEQADVATRIESRG